MWIAGREQEKAIENSQLKYRGDDAGNLHIMEIRIKVEMKVVEIQNENQLTHEQCDQVLATYNDNKLVKMFHTEQDFFFVQHLFLMQTIKQMSTQEMFGLLIV